MPAITEDAHCATRQRSSHSLRPASIFHFCCQGIDLPDQPEQEGKDQFWDDDCWFRYAPAKRHDNSLPGRRGMIDMISMPACLQNKLQVRTGFEEAAVQRCPLT